jgi:hypothetical protein
MLTGQVVQAAVGKDVAPADPVPVTDAAAAVAGQQQQQQQQGRLFTSLLGAVDVKWRSLQRVGKDVAPADPVPVTDAAAAAAAAGQQQQGRLFASLLGAVDVKWRSLQRMLPERVGWQKWQLQKWPEARGK